MRSLSDVRRDDRRVANNTEKTPGNLSSKQSRQDRRAVLECQEIGNMYKRVDVDLF